MWKWWEPEELGGGGQKDQEPPTGGARVGDECEAWLAGDWAEYRAAQGKAVPSWAWLNQVAHASESAVRVMTRVIPGSRADTEASRLRACVAEALVDQAAEKRLSISDLQRSVLVPIELALFGEQDPRPDGGTLLMIRVLTALRHPSAQPGSR